MKLQVQFLTSRDLSAPPNVAMSNESPEPLLGTPLQILKERERERGRKRELHIEIYLTDPKKNTHNLELN